MTHSIETKKDQLGQSDETDYLKKLLLLASIEISKKNKILSEINKKLKGNDKEIDVRDLTALIQSELTSQENHTAIEMVRVNNDFFEKLEKRFPFLSEGDKQLCGYCLISLSSKDIAIIKGVQIKTVEMARYRLRKKLSIPRDSSISKFLQLLD